MKLHKRLFYRKLTFSFTFQSFRNDCVLSKIDFFTINIVTRNLNNKCRQIRNRYSIRNYNIYIFEFFVRLFHTRRRIFNELRVNGVA